jgi:phosphotriesterase-related protein
MPRRRPFIQTVKGPVEPDRIGQTLLHEHLVADWDLALGRAPHLSSMDVAAKIVDCLDHAGDVGISCVVDVGPESFALSPIMMRLIAEQTSVHVIAATGCWKPLALPLPDWVYPPASAEDIADHFIRAARFGIGDSEIRPGLITVATDAGPTNSLEENILKAAAIAQRATGLAITTHTTSIECAEAQVEVLGNAGADLDRVAIGRVGLRAGAAGFPLFERLAKQGVALGIDNFGMIRPDEEWTQMVVQLVEAGYVDNVILSHDTTVIRRGMEGIYEKRTVKDKNIRGIEDLKNIPEEPTEGDFTLIHSRLLPKLRGAGIEDLMINKMLIDNPRKILTIDPHRYPDATTGEDR